MKSFKHYITELFDKPYKWKISWGKGISRDTFKEKNGMISYEFKTDDGRACEVMMHFSKDFSPKGNYIKAVAEFEVDDDYELSGKGDAPRIMSTVMDTLKDGIKKMRPEVITFTADKEEGFGQTTQKTGRAKLYKAMVKRFANKLGYIQGTQDVGDMIKFTLISKEFKKRKRKPKQNVL